jgi:hypothetical protein
MQIGEGVSKPALSQPQPPCEDDAHQWEESKPGKSADDQMASLTEAAAEMEGKPSQAGGKRGLEFEKKAVEKNKDTLPVDRCGREYRCRTCGKTQEVDITGGGRVAEAKSQKAKGVKNSSAQCKRLKSIQAQCLEQQKKPLAKLDASLEDVDAAEVIYKRRGFEVERVL